MSKFILPATVIVSLTVSAGALWAQSGTRSGSGSRTPTYRPSSPPRNTTWPQATPRPSAGSTSRTSPAPLRVAMNGYSPVAVSTQRRWLIGTPRLQSKYDGKVYHFASTQERDAFEADPARYVPALGGDCIVCFAKSNARVPGSVQHAAISDGRVFLFPSEAEKAEFLTNPGQFLNADLAFNGNCAVCFVKGGQTVQGRPDFTATHNGLRYLFPSAAERAEFQRSPATYVARLGSSAPSGSSSR